MYISLKLLGFPEIIQMMKLFHKRMTNDNFLSLKRSKVFLPNGSFLLPAKSRELGRPFNDVRGQH